MNSKASVNPTSIKWLAGDEQIVADYFLDLGLRSLKEILDMRVFDLMVNACSVDGAAADGNAWAGIWSGLPGTASRTASAASGAGTPGGLTGAKAATSTSPRGISPGRSGWGSRCPWWSPGP